MLHTEQIYFKVLFSAGDIVSVNLQDPALTEHITEGLPREVFKEQHLDSLIIH